MVLHPVFYKVTAGPRHTGASQQLEGTETIRQVGRGEGEEGEGAGAGNGGTTGLRNHIAHFLPLSLDTTGPDLV